MGTVAQTASEDLVVRFETAAQAAAAVVHRIPRTATAIVHSVRALTPAGSRIAVATPQWISPELISECLRLPGLVTERTRAALSQTEVGVTDAFAGVASSGSVCVRIDEGDAGYISLLTRIQIAILDSSRLVPRPSTLFRADCLDGIALSANFVFITGPSATADMGPLVRGVHGPHHLHILLLV